MLYQISAVPERQHNKYRVYGEIFAPKGISIHPADIFRIEISKATHFQEDSRLYISTEYEELDQDIHLQRDKQPEKLAPQSSILGNRLVLDAGDLCASAFATHSEGHL